MRFRSLTRRLVRSTVILAIVGTVPTGCGSGQPPTGTQIDVTIPKEEAAKQNDAYKQYAKQGRSGPSSGSPNQRNRSNR